MDQVHSGSAAPSTAPDHGRRRALLIAGDVAAFLVFAAIGRRSHGEAAGLDAFLAVAATAAPFIAGWWLTAPFVGAYRRAATAGLGPMLQRTALAWLIAWPVGLALRALLLGRGIPVSFAIVTLLTNALIICGWRALFAWLESRRTPER